MINQSNDYKRIIEVAANLAKHYLRPNICPDLLFDSLLRNANLSVGAIFSTFRIPIAEALTVSQIVVMKKKEAKRIGFSLTKTAKKILGDAEVVSSHFEQDDLRPEMLLLSLCVNSDHVEALNILMENYDIDKRDFEKTIVSFLNDEEEEGFSLGTILPDEDEFIVEKDVLDMFAENRILDQFGDNLNIKARRGEFDNLIPFNDIIQHLATVMCRKTKPNAILVGPEGGGKTSVVELLARSIVMGDAPELLHNKVIYSVSLSSMVAGTQFRGQFEERLERFINEAKRYRNVILFIDEIHTLVGAGGSGNHDLEASNMLKPALARGEISCIGATTLNEFNKTISKDGALSRRFEKIFVNPPSKAQMEKALPQIISYYSQYHCVDYSEDFTKNVLDYCERLLPNRKFPDKAIDVIDHCGAVGKMKFCEMPPKIKELREELTGIDEESSMEKIEEKLKELTAQMQGWEDKLREENGSVGMDSLNSYFVTKTSAISSKGGVGAAFQDSPDLTETQRSVLEKLGKECTKAIAKKQNSPISILIHGESGSGRSYLLDRVSENFLNTGAQVFQYNGFELDHLVKVDGEHNSLYQRINMIPNAVIVIDDFDKCDGKLFEVFKKILKDGRATSFDGDIIDFSATTFVLAAPSKTASNLGFSQSNSNTSARIDIDFEKMISVSVEIGKPTETDLSIIFDNKCRFYQIKDAEAAKKEILSDASKKQNKIEFIFEQIIERAM